MQETSELEEAELREAELEEEAELREAGLEEETELREAGLEEVEGCALEVHFLALSCSCAFPSREELGGIQAPHN